MYNNIYVNRNWIDINPPESEKNKENEDEFIEEELEEEFEDYVECEWPDEN